VTRPRLQRRLIHPLAGLLLGLIVACGGEEINGRSLQSWIGRLRYAPREAIDETRITAELIHRHQRLRLAKRREAARQLAEAARGAGGEPALADDGLIAAVTWALGDLDPAVRVPAAASLAWNGRQPEAAALVLLDAMRSNGAPEARRDLFAWARGADLALDRALPRYAASLQGVLMSDVWAFAGDDAATTTTAPAIESLVAQIQSGPREESLAAALELARRGDEAEPALPALRAMIQRGDEAQVRAAAWALGRLGHAAATARPLLAHRLKYARTWETAVVLAWALARLDPLHIETYDVELDTLRFDDPRARLSAAAAFARMPLDVEPGSRYLAAFLETLRDSDSAVRHAAVVVLGRARLANRASRAALIAAAASDDVQLAAAALLALAKAPDPDPETVGRLLEALGDPRPEIRAAAARGLGELVAALSFPNDALVDAARNGGLRPADPSLPAERLPVDLLLRLRAAEPIRAMLTDPDPALRAAAVEAVIALRDHAPATVESLLRLLSDGDAGVRARATAALGLLGSTRSETAAALRERLNDPHPDVRLCAAAGLIWLNQADFPVLETMRDGLERASLQLAAEATNLPATVEQIPEYLLTEARLELLQPTPLATYACREALLALAWLGQQGAPLGFSIHEFLRSPAARRLDRRLAAAALLRLHPEIAPPDGIPAPPAVGPRAYREQAVLGLGWLGAAGREAAPDLAAIAGDAAAPTPLRVAAAASLSRVVAANHAGPASTISATTLNPLIAMLRTDDPALRMAGAHALGSIGRAARVVAGDLTLLTEDADPRVRSAARNALERIR